MNNNPKTTMQEIKNIFDQKYPQLFVLESGQVIRAYKKDVVIDNNGTAHLKSNYNDISHEDLDHENC